MATELPFDPKRPFMDIDGQLKTFGFYADRRIYGRVWKGWFPSEDNFHYAYSDGELDPEGRLIWTQASTEKPYGVETISEAQAAALLIESRWPNLTAEGWEMELATQIISGIIYGRQLSMVKKHGIGR